MTEMVQIAPKTSNIWYEGARLEMGHTYSVSKTYAATLTDKQVTRVSGKGAPKPQRVTSTGRKGDKPKPASEKDVASLPDTR